MQKLQLELKNVPVDVFQVPCSTNPELNRDQSLSAQDKVLDCNNLEGNQPQQTEEFKAKVFVFVLSIEGKPLMPCKPAKARKLLKSGKAKVVKRFPFTIQLLFECENQVQECKLGIDSGYRNIGFSVISEKYEFISGTLILDDKTSKRLGDKRMYRKFRRSRHHWYRERRFLNRKTPEGWLPPSVQRRYNTHLNLIKKIKSLVPIIQTIVEVANFNIQKLENPGIEGIEYQQGDRYGYQN